MAIIWTPKNEMFTDFDAPGYPKKMRPTYEGAVVRVYGEERRVMSDVWAWVTIAECWNGTELVYVPVRYSDPESHLGTATVDATPEVLAQVAIVRAAAAVRLAQIEKDAAEERRRHELLRLETGKTVRVVKGRKVAKGTTGVCFWMGESQYGVRVGIKDAAGTVHWTAATNVEVVL